MTRGCPCGPLVAPLPRTLRNRSLRGRIAALGVAAFTAMLTLTSSAHAWWNEEWSLRKQITVDTSATGANITDAIGTTPLLVRLHIGNFNFGGAKEDGSDLRFVTEDDQTPLKHHIESYDSLLGEALIWVGVPNVQSGATMNLWLYYGNDHATAVADPAATYDGATQLVYHFSERGTAPQDSSVWANHGQSAGQTADGAIIGNGLRLDGQTPLSLPASPSLAVQENGALTWSAWIRPASLQRNAAIYSRREGRNALVIGLDDGAPFVEITVNGVVQRTTTAAPVAPGGWHHLAMVATPGLVTLYLDGNSYASLTASLPALNSVALLGGDTVPAAPPPAAVPVAPTVSPAAAPASGPGGSTAPSGTGVGAGDPGASSEVEPDGEASAPAADGSSEAAPAVTAPAFTAPAPVAQPAPTVAAMPGFAGEIDELTIANTARSAGFIRMAAIGQGINGASLVTFSVDEETASWLSGHFGVLIRAVTFDGWVVIGILAVMALASWVVMVEKHGYLKKQRKANDAFLPAFRALTDDLTQLAEGGEEDVDGTGKAKRRASAGGKTQNAIRRHSSLYRIYQIGAAEIRKRFPDGAAGGRHALNAEGIAAIRAALDAGLVREMQGLNRMMVILTISISGGPFLGLLGTVIGVMITFAAIAMSGDVNINAIAPGVAGALMATVAGLAVAIPALFGYNWLTLRIRDLISDMQVFVDEFTTRMAEASSNQRPDPVVHRMAAE